MTTGSETPCFTVIIPTLNRGHKLALTLDSLVRQEGKGAEIIVVDAGSKDRTLEIVKSYNDPRISLISMGGFSPYEMMNRGIGVAKEGYVSLLFPGDVYLSNETFTLLKQEALTHGMPDLIYTGCLIREARKEPKVLYRPLTLELLLRGKQPTSLESLWIQKKVFRTIGKFNTHFRLQGGYDFLCRFWLNGSLTSHGIFRVTTDYDLQSTTKNQVIRHFLETSRIVYRYFGLNAWLKWLLRQTELKRYLGLLWRSLKASFTQGD